MANTFSGSFKADIAFDSCMPKELSALVVVEDDNGWHVDFVVRLGDVTKTTQNLAMASRAFSTGKWW